MTDLKQTKNSLLVLRKKNTTRRRSRFRISQDQGRIITARLFSSAYRHLGCKVPGEVGLWAAKMTNEAKAAALAVEEVS